MALRCSLKLQPPFKSGGFLKTSVVHNLILRTFASISKPKKCLTAVRKDTSIKRRFFFSFFKKPSVVELKIKDDVPDEYQLIYRNGMHRYLRFAQVFTSVSFVGGCLLCCAGTSSQSTKFDIRQIDSSTAMDYLGDEVSVYIASFALFWAMIYILVERMPIRIYSLAQKRKYIFVFYRNLPFSNTRIKCLGNEVVKLEESGVLPWKDSRYKINKNQRIIMLENFFRRPADLNIMLGYQEAPADYD